MSSWGSSWKDSWGSAWGAQGNADVKVSWLQFDTQGNADVKVSWLQFDTQATPCDVKVSWLEFNTQAVPHDVKVSWMQFNTQATKPQDGKSGVNRLFYYQLQEEALKEKTERAKPLPYVEPYKVEELEDGSAVIILDEIRERSKVVKPVSVEPQPQVRKAPARVTVEPTSDMMLVWNTSLEVRALLNSYQQNMVKFKHDLDVANDEDDIELLLLVA